MRIYKPVTNKSDFVKRYAAGEFGNAGPTWSSVHEWATSDFDLEKLYHLRNRIKGGPTHYNITGEDLLYLCNYSVKCWSHQPCWYVSEMAPTEKTIIQGEVRLSENTLDLTYTRVALPMRDALAKQTKTASGIIAVTILKETLCTNSYEWLQELLTNYPGHVVEFSTYSTNWGTLPNFNTVYWECRAY